MTSPLISLLLPTRGRPMLVERFLRSISETTSQLERIEVILYVDEDDFSSHYLDSEDVNVVRIIGPGMSMGAYNSAFLARARGKIIILANDDMVIQTPGWDSKVVEMDAEFTDKIYLAYSNDLNKGRSLCTFPILSRRTCELLVEPYPIAYQGAFIDVHLFDIFKRVQHAGFDRVRYLEDVIFEHLHYRTGKAVYDETYKGRGRFADDRTFITMVDNRSEGAKRLLSQLLGGVLPAFKRLQCDEYLPYGMLGALNYFFRKFLFDKELPIRWRGFLGYWFIGRYLAAHGYLWPFVR